MKSVLTLLFAVAFAGPTFAQIPIVSDTLQPGFSTQPFTSDMLTDGRKTPTMRRQQVVRILALKEEAARLRAEDGGRLSKANLIYIRNAARNILRN